MHAKIGFMGGGRITAIFLAAWKGGGIDLQDVVVSDPDAEVLVSLKAHFPEIQIVSENRLSAAQDVVILSLHPPVAKTVLPEIANTLSPKAPSMVHRGFNPCVFGPGLGPEDRALHTRLKG
jgi:pyrroline-5-carboxylate reductase